MRSRSAPERDIFISIKIAREKTGADLSRVYLRAVHKPTNPRISTSNKTAIINTVVTFFTLPCLFGESRFSAVIETRQVMRIFS